MSLFTGKAPGVMSMLMADFGLDVVSAAAILGNIGHECRGFTDLVEKDPKVGGLGGIGWCQWTGQTRGGRRRLFEDYCARNNLDRFGDKANYGWMVVELRDSHKSAIDAVKKADGLEAKVRAFEAAYEKAGVKNWPSRIKYAKEALAAYEAVSVKNPPFLPEPIVIAPTKPVAPVADGLGIDTPDYEKPATGPRWGRIALLVAVGGFLIAGGIWLWLKFH